MAVRFNFHKNMNIKIKKAKLCKGGSADAVRFQGFYKPEP